MKLLDKVETKVVDAEGLPNHQEALIKHYKLVALCLRSAEEDI